MQFRVVIPEHVKSGQYIRIHCPDGTEAEMRVPKGLKPGDSFVFDINDKDSKITIANDVQMLNQQVAASSNHSHASSHSNDRNFSKGGGEGSSSGNDGSDSNSNNGSNFLDREVLHLKDFLVALGIGLLIGISIVVGFVIGVLSATSGIQEKPFHGALSDTTPGGIGVYQLQNLQQGKLLQRQQSLQQLQQQQQQQQEGYSRQEL